MNISSKGNMTRRRGLNMYAIFSFIAVLHVYLQGAYSSEDDHHDEDHDPDIENALLSSIFANYNSISVPLSPGGPLVVNLGLAVNRIVDLDEKNQILFSAVWLRMTWSDSRLSWNESLYGHIEDIHVPITSIWRPDIILYNDVTEEQRTLDAYKAQVKSDGSVKWLAPALYQSYCKLDVQYFPKDLQVCPMKFGSWSFHGDHLDLVNMTEYGDVSNYVANGEWELVALPVVRHVVMYQCCSEAYPDVTFYFVMRRRSLYYMFNIMVPCIFIVSIALLTFYLPPESGEKVSLVVTVLLALTVFMLLVAEIMPPQADAIPLIAIYFGCAILLLCFSTAMTVMVMNMQYSGAHGARAPPWLRRIVFGNLAKAMCLQRLVQQNLENWNPSEVQDKVAPAANGKIPKKDEEYVTTETPVQKFTSTASLCRTPQIRPLSAPPEDKKRNNQDNDTLTEILRRLDGFEEHWKMKRRYDICKMEWELIVLVVDRMFLFVFFFMTFVINLIFLAYNPDTSDYSLDVQ